MHSTMIQAYNFFASWQLFPEKGLYESGERPRSGFYKIGKSTDELSLLIEHTWVMLNNQAFSSAYSILADGNLQPFQNKELAEEAQVEFKDSGNLLFTFYKDGQTVLSILHHILPNGYLKIIQDGIKSDGTRFSNSEVYHKQMSVLPYSSSVGGALIKPTEEGVIKHKALSAMEEQTNMQLDQIRQQIELLAVQAQQIQKRKELSMMIYNAKLSFQPTIGQTYYMYQKKDGNYLLSLVSAKEWGNSMPYQSFISAVKLLADHTWVEM
ncbi:MAG: DUF2452 domain-containing protein [Ferruginibacter sp.]